MYGHAARFSRLRHWLTALRVLAVAGGGTLIGLGILRWSTPELLSLWLVAVGGAVVLLFVAITVLCFVLIKVDANGVRATAAMHDVLEELQAQRARMEEIAENSRLSDAARSLSHRQEERNALRAAIDAEIDRHDWEAAAYLIAEMERRFGYKEEAQRLANHIRQEQAAFYQAEVERVVPMVEQLFDAHAWGKASQEISRLLKAFPNESRFAQLKEELSARRRARKDELVRDFTDAVQRDDIDIDAGMNILKELDQYLTREEAKQLEESARKVVKGKLLQLGVRFRFAVSEERWQDALEVAVNIIEEFPNSQIAKEVRERLAVLRERAGLPTDVEVTSPAPRPPH
ncbi:MAG: hypothetical protein ACE5GE_17565 [Phycisphaerae bacterium]